MFDNSELTTIRDTCLPVVKVSRSFSNDGHHRIEQLCRNKIMKNIVKSPEF